MKTSVKIALAVSGFLFVAAGVSVASINASVPESSSTRSAVIQHSGKAFPLARSDDRRLSAMLLPNAMEKAAEETSLRRAAMYRQRMREGKGAQLDVIRLR